MNVHLNDISSTAEPFVTKLGMVMDQSAMQESRFAVFKFRVTVRAHMIKYMTVSNISIELLIFLHPNLVGWHIIISLRGVLFLLLSLLYVCV